MLTFLEKSAGKLDQLVNLQLRKIGALQDLKTVTLQVKIISMHSISFSQILSDDDEGDPPMTHFCEAIFPS